MVRSPKQKSIWGKLGRATGVMYAVLLSWQQKPGITVRKVSSKRLIAVLLQFQLVCLFCHHFAKRVHGVDTQELRNVGFSPVQQQGS